MMIKIMPKSCLYIASLVISLGLAATVSANTNSINHEIILLGKSAAPSKSSADRFIYKLNGIFVVVTPGDLIDGCTVNRVGQLLCGNKEEADFLATTLQEKENEIEALYSELTVLNHQYEELKNDQNQYENQLESLDDKRDEQRVLIAKLRDIATKQAHQISTMRHTVKQIIDSSVAQVR